MKLGINTWAWKLPVDESNFDRFLDWAESLALPGGDLFIECFASPDAGDLATAAAMRKMAEDRGFGMVACGFNPNMLGPGQPSPSMVSDDAAERRAAIDRACGFVRYAAEVAVGGAPGILSGPWHTRHMHFTGSGLSPRERQWLVDGLRETARCAGQHNVRAGFEILNRFESYVINTVDEALSVIDEVGEPALGINWDTSHAHIDESSDVIDNLKHVLESGRLFHIHLCENHRRTLGTGKIGPRLAEMLATMRTAGYQYGAGLELFCEPLDPAVHKWNRCEGSPDEAARNSVDWLRTCLESSSP